MSLYVCVACHRGMRCEFNGIGVDYDNGHVYPGDLWQCPECKVQIIATIGRAIHDPCYDKHQRYLVAKQTNKITENDDRLSLKMAPKRYAKRK